VIDLLVDKIVEFANRHDADLIMMGSNGISRLIMGNVSRNVLEKLRCSVMIVR
jgi:nucleotide-binding universal stress UspA family protein